MLIPPSLPPGYVRIALALYAFGVSFISPLQTVLLYFFSFVCDELDGRFARMLNQTSTLGAVLDMVTDRCVCLCGACNISSTTTTHTSAAHQQSQAVVRAYVTAWSHTRTHTHTSPPHTWSPTYAPPPFAVPPG